MLALAVLAAIVTPLSLLINVFNVIANAVCALGHFLLNANPAALASNLSTVIHVHPPVKKAPSSSRRPTHVLTALQVAKSVQSMKIVRSARPAKL